MILDKCLHGCVCVYVCVYVRVCVCACARMHACVRAYVRACVCVYMCIPLYFRNYAVDFNQIVLIFLYFYSVLGKKIILYELPSRFLIYFEFLIFEKFVFEFF